MHKGLTHHSKIKYLFELESFEDSFVNVFYSILYLNKYRNFNKYIFQLKSLKEKRKICYVEMFRQPDTLSFKTKHPSGDFNRHAAAIIFPLST